MNYVSSTMLWIGPLEEGRKAALNHIQKQYCISNVCGSCYTCKQIIAEEHYAYLPLTTAKTSYVRADLDALFSKISFKGSTEDPLFCVIYQAEKLSLSCANSLLKLLDEPPLGWHWILLTERPQELLDTITSRCLVRTLSSLHDSVRHELYLFFTAPAVGDSVTFQHILERCKITEYESRQVYDAILAYWTSRSYSNEQLLPWVTFLHTFLSLYPMPGSSKFFWRTMYLRMACLVG